MDSPESRRGLATPSRVIAARHAMATRFEIVLHGDDPVALQAAAGEALDEVQRLENELSLYRPATDIARVNALAYREPVRVSPAVFHLLQLAEQIHRETDGAFDITIGPLLRCWGLMGATGRVPSPEEIAEARSRVGMNLVHFDAAQCAVRFEREGVMLDLGAIGKGYAVEKAAELLRELGVTSALVHGGTSTVCAIGRPPDAAAWKVALELPPAASPSQTNRQEARPALLATVPICDESLSVSAVWGKSFTSAGRTYGHVIDPRTGAPAESAVMAAVVLPSATETDAFSTALLTLGFAGLPRLAAVRPGLKACVAGSEGDSLRVEAAGLAPETRIRNPR